MARQRKVGPGSVFRRKSDGRPTAQLRWTDEDGQRQSAVFYGKTLTEARSKLRDAVERLEAGGPVRDSSASVNAWVDEWIETALEAKKCARSTKDTYAQMARKHIQPGWFGAMALGDVRASHVEKLLTSKRAPAGDESFDEDDDWDNNGWGDDARDDATDDAERPGGALSGNTLRILYTVLRAVFGTAVRDQLLKTSPMEKVDRPSAHRHEARFLTVDEAQQLLTALADDDRLLPIVRMLLLTGVRRGELLGLRWVDVDLDGGELFIRRNLVRASDGLKLRQKNKTEKSRRKIPLEAPAVEALKARRASQAAERLRAGAAWRDTGLVFTTPQGGPLEPANVRNRFARVAAAAGFPDVTLKTFRHSAASFLVADGVPLKVVQELLGHSSYRITADIYSHVSKASGRDAADRLGKAFG